MKGGRGCGRIDVEGGRDGGRGWRYRGGKVAGGGGRIGEWSQMEAKQVEGDRSNSEEDVITRGEGKIRVEYAAGEIGEIGRWWTGGIGGGMRWREKEGIEWREGGGRCTTVVGVDG